MSKLWTTFWRVLAFIAVIYAIVCFRHQNVELGVAVMALAIACSAKGDLAEWEENE